jgi:hypothetical protein
MANADDTACARPKFPLRGLSRHFPVNPPAESSRDDVVRGTMAVVEVLALALAARRRREGGCQCFHLEDRAIEGLNGVLLILGERDRALCRTEGRGA